MARHYRRRRFGLLGTALKVVLLLAVVLGVICGVSVWRLSSTLSATEQSLSLMDEDIDKLDFVSASGHAHESSQGIDELMKELEGPQWDVVATIPYIGQDVRIARELTSIAGVLVRDSMAPVLDELADLPSTFDIKDILTGGLGSSATEVLNAAIVARDHVGTCRHRLDELEDSHFEFMNKFKDELVDSTEEISATFDRFSAGLDFAGVVTGILT